MFHRIHKLKQVKLECLIEGFILQFWFKLMECGTLNCMTMLHDLQV